MSTLTTRAAGPHGGSRWDQSNGHLHPGTHNPRGNLCGRACVLHPDPQGMTEEPRRRGERLLLARISWRGRCRAVGVGRRGRGPCRGERLQAAPAPLSGHAPGSTPAVLRPRRAAARDAGWSCGGTPAQRQGGWLARAAPPGQSLPARWTSAVGRARQRGGSSAPPGSRSGPRSLRSSRRATRAAALPPRPAPSPSWPAGPLPSTVVTVRDDRASPGWGVRRSRFHRSLLITVEPANTASVTITSPEVQHYQDSTTGFGSAFRYEFSGKVYQGSTATPGSVQPRPEARKVQYRLYYEVNYQVFTDGILHQHELQEDAMTP